MPTVTDWYQARKEAIRNRVSAHDLLRKHGIRLRYSTDRSEQLKCPFHGKDESPSARVHPTHDDSPSHLWCYVCRKNWDVIGLQMEFSHQSFTEALSQLEIDYGIEKPEFDFQWTPKERPPDPEVESWKNLVKICEARLRVARDAYARTQDWTGFAKANVFFDRVCVMVDIRSKTRAEGIELLERYLEKLSERIRDDL